MFVATVNTKHFLGLPMPETIADIENFEGTTVGSGQFHTNTVVFTTTNNTERASIQKVT